MALTYIGPTIWSKIADTLKRTKKFNMFKHSLKEHYLKGLKSSDFRQLFILETKVCNILLFQCLFNCSRYFFTFVQEPQQKYKQFDACIVLSCHQQKCCIFVNIAEYNLFDILLLSFTVLIFNFFNFSILQQNEAIHKLIKNLNKLDKEQYIKHYTQIFAQHFAGIS